MSIEQTGLRLIFDATFVPYLIEQTDELKLVEEVRNAAARERAGESIFEKRPDLAAAAYYLLAKSRHGKSEAGHRTLDTLKAAIHGAMSPGVNGEPSIQRALLVDFHLRGIIYESPMAFYGLTHYLGRTTLVHHAGYSRFSASQFIDHNPYEDLLGDYRFGNSEILDIFDLLQPNGHVFESVRSHLSDSANLARLDALVSKETSGPEMPQGVSLATGLRVLFSHRGDGLDALVRQEPLDAHSGIITAIRHRTENGALAARRPGSGIERFMALNGSLPEATQELVRTYNKFTTNGLEALPFQTSLYIYLTIVTGRQLPLEDTWDYLQAGRPGLPVRDAIIEALGVHPEEFDRVMERAAQQGIFGDGLRSPGSRDSRRPEPRRLVK
jgi:hypothetical protein